MIHLPFLTEPKVWASWGNTPRVFPGEMGPSHRIHLTLGQSPPQLRGLGHRDVFIHRCHRRHPMHAEPKHLFGVTVT